jgi:hypothetical protein
VLLPVREADGFVIVTVTVPVSPGIKVEGENVTLLTAREGWLVWAHAGAAAITAIMSTTRMPANFI